MFFLKFLFILMIIAFVILLTYTIYTKIKNPHKSFINCIPFMDEFAESDVDHKEDNADATATIDPLTRNIVSSTDQLASAATKAKKTTKPKTVTKPKAVSKKSTTKKPAAKKTPNKTKKKGDNIKKINGIGPVFEKKLNSIGIHKFEHIAAWSDADVERIDNELELSGRPQREEWVAKAKILAAENS